MTRSMLFALACCASLAAHADQTTTATTTATETAMNAILVAEGIEIVHAEALADGVVEVIFGVSVADHELTRAVDRLRAHPDIRDVIAQTSPRTFCRVD